MSIKWYDVEAIAPELKAALATTQTAILAIVDRQVNDAAWGSRADDARRYLAAHLGTLALRKGRGAVTSETVGSLSQSYAAPPNIVSSLRLTPYGEEYLRLARLTGAYLGAITGGGC